MPNFTYTCNECQHLFDFLILTASETAICPKCKSKNLKKMATTFASVSANSRFETNAPDIPSLRELHLKKDTPPKKLNKNEIFKDF